MADDDHRSPARPPSEPAIVNDDWGGVSACLIVRDEAARLAACLATVAPFADEIVVADTGSTDNTIAIAAAAGARVIRVDWTDDFAAARNAALESCTYRWVLSVDADERVHGVAAWLPVMLAALDDGAAALSLEITEVGAQNPRGHVRHHAPKLFRRDRCRWRGRVHEEIVLLDSGHAAPVPLEMPAAALRLDHLGYADAAVAAVKVERNLRLAELELADLVASHAPARDVTRALLDLGRSQLANGERDGGRTTLREVRERSRPGSQPWLWATDFLAWDAVRHGEAGVADALARELGAAGAPADYLRKLASEIAYLHGDRPTGDALAAAITAAVTVTGRPA